MGKQFLYKLVYVWVALLVGLSTFGCSKETQGSRPEGFILYTADDEGASEIYILDLDTEQEIQVTDDGTDKYHLSLSPDGKRITFASDKSGSSEIYVMDLDGTNLTQLTFDGNIAFTPKWSPDGEWIMYDQWYDYDAIFKIRADGSKTHLLLDNQYICCALWSPDGNKIAFSAQTMIRRDARDIGNYEIYIADLVSGIVTQVTNHIGGDGVTSWSPDGRYLLFYSSRELAWNENRVYVLEIASGEIWPLIKDGEISTGVREQNAIWSPDGDWIVLSIDGRMCIVDKEGNLYKCYGDYYNPEDWGAKITR